MPPPTRPSRAAPMKRMQPRRAEKTISKKPATMVKRKTSKMSTRDLMASCAQTTTTQRLLPATKGKRNKSVKKKPAGRVRRIAMPARTWLKMMGCAISGLEIAGMEALDDASDERFFLVCEELREIINIAETHINGR